MSRLWMLEAYWPEGGSLTDRVRTYTYPGGLPDWVNPRLAQYYAERQAREQGMKVTRIYQKEIE